MNNTIDSLKVLGDETGGFCICNTNDFKRDLQRIDNETSDYYLHRLTTSNPDPLKSTPQNRDQGTRPGVASRLPSGIHDQAADKGKSGR